jgi:pimeloyl-ACP methyl ester carboxylesterase
MTELSADYFLEVLRHTADDLRLSVDVLAVRDDVRDDELILAGFSMGAMAALLAATADDRVAGLISASGSSVADLLDISIAGARSAGAEARAWAHSHDVAHQLRRFAPKPLLLQHGRPDDMVPVGNTLRLHETALPFYAAYPERLGLMLYEHTHLVTTQQIGDAVEWASTFFGAEAA